MNLGEEPPPEKKKKRKTNNSSPPPSHPSSHPSFSSLPEEISVNCLAWISRSYYPTLSLVSKRFRSLLSSSGLYAARSHLGSTEKCVYVCLSYPSHQRPQWFRLWINPNRTIPNSMVKKKKKAIEQLLVPIPDSNLSALPSLTTVAVGSELYVIGGPFNQPPSSSVRVLDCRSHTWRDAPSMNVARKYALSCVYDGKIYVTGGCKGVDEEEAWAEVFDTKTQTWERLLYPGNEHVCRIAEIQGKIYFTGRNKSNYAYDTKQCKWECIKGLIAEVPSPEDVREYFSRSYLRCSVYDAEDGEWKEVNGLESVEDKYRRNGGSSGCVAKVVRCGGKLFVMWEGKYTRNKPHCMKKIWCAEIELERRDGGEIWGNVEWVDVVLTVPMESRILRCHAVPV
ncbi:unnamed protein product [Microthlaspi erraticum]|uniref:F-box domain-containing protein n=1 Tax=Microthlaspi erraticum TaxID=1685480 RepID=A0A6D2HYY5_9BRAS|nr:unnamed protein product [Microthlaspi erraticum]CAA7054819.1 unnamed protein product [Microthlaspi erraticum]CAA7057217.1 unnamed protein product [Microthlaspi erraticum]